MRSHFTLFENLKTRELNPQLQLKTLRKAIRPYIDAHNQVVNLLREVEYQIALKRAEASSHVADLNALQKLENERTALLDCLKRNNSEEIIHQKLQQIEALEHALGNPVNKTSPSFLKRD